MPVPRSSTLGTESAAPVVDGATHRMTLGIEPGVEDRPVGIDGAAVSVGGGSAEVQPFAAVSYLEGLANYAVNHPGSQFQVYYDRGVLPYSDLANATNFTTSQTDGKAGLKAEYFNNADLKGTPVITRTEEHVDFGTAARLLFPGADALVTLDRLLHPARIRLLRNLRANDERSRRLLSSLRR